MRINTINTIEKYIGKINPRYDMTVSDVQNIYENAHGDTFEMITSAFVFGYAQGTKAEKSDTYPQT